MSNTNRPVMSIAKVSRLYKRSGKEGKIVCVVGNITNDLRIMTIPKMTVSFVL